MNRHIYTIIFVFCIFALSGCSKVSGMFAGDEDNAHLEGKRISVLELQKSLTPKGAKKALIAPEAWHNAFWPQAGGYPNHSMQNLSLPSNLTRIWKADIGSGSRRGLPLTANPVVAGGVIYTLDTDSKVRAFDTKSGKQVWQADIENKDEDENVISGGISYADGYLFITDGYDEIISLDAKSGNIRWKKDLPTPSRAAPSIMDGRVFVPTIDNRLIALDEKSGNTLWSYSGISGTAGLLGGASPAVNTDIVVQVFSSGEITALRVENGSVAWSDNIASVRRYGSGLESLSDINAMPVLDSNLVIAISFGGKMVAFDESSGIRVWQREISGLETPWVAGNFLFVLSSDQQLIALNIKDGTIIWVSQMPRFKNESKKKHPLQWKGPVMASGRLILTGTGGRIIEVDSKNGDIIKSWETGKSIISSPIVAGDTLFLLADDGTLMAYR